MIISVAMVIDTKDTSFWNFCICFSILVSSVVKIFTPVFSWSLSPLKLHSLITTIEYVYKKEREGYFHFSKFSFPLLFTRYSALVVLA